MPMRSGGQRTSYYAMKVGCSPDLPIPQRPHRPDCSAKYVLPRIRGIQGIVEASYFQVATVTILICGVGL